MTAPDYRFTNLAMAGFCVLMMTVALVFFQYYLGLAPCNLCISQRVFVIVAGALALGAFVHNPARRIWRALWSLSVLIAALCGAAVAGRHVWIQMLPEDRVPACGPPLEFLMDNAPFGELLGALLLGDGDCAEVLWQFLGLSIPGWTLVGLLMLALAAAWQLRRALLSG